MKTPNNSLKLGTSYEQRKHFTSYETTPRQRRLHAERRFLLAQYYSVIADILGVIVLAIIIIALFYFA